ncbi:MAG: cobalt-precorrin 5A hydrolase [Lachnospirales bacterium]
MDNVCVIAFTAKGIELAKKLNIGDVFTYFKYSDDKNSFHSIKEIMAMCWEKYRGIIFISACGIAVRAIAPYVSNKINDPAVVVCDEKGNYVISLLSGHIGGANDLAKKIAKKTKGTAIITTATDVLDRFAVDMWAKKNKFVLKDMKMAKEVSSAVVNGDRVGFVGDIKCPDGLCDSKDCKIGIFLGHTIEKPFKKTLILAKKCLVVGVGCKKDTPFEKIKEAFDRLFNEYNLNPDSVKMISSVSVKANEIGIMKLAENLDVTFATYSINYLGKINGNFSHSEFVEKTIGLDCVCERAALAKGGKLIVPKQIYEGVTLAVAKI